MSIMIKPQLIRLERYLFHIKCPYCNYEWDSETNAERRMSCSKCKSSLRFKQGWRERVPPPRYFSINPETGEETELFPKTNTNTTSPVSPPTPQERDIKKNVKSKFKSK